MSNKIPIGLVIEDFNKRGLQLVSTEYKGVKDKLQYICLKHKEKGIQEITYDSLRGSKFGCWYCRNEYIKNQKTLSLQSVRDFINSCGYKLLSDEYENAHAPLLLQCSNGHIINMSYNDFQQGKRCYKCQGKIRRTTKSLYNEIEELTNGEYTLLGEFANVDTKTLIKHNTCNKSWEITPYHFITRNQRCPFCVGKNVQGTTESFKQDVYNLVGKEYTVVGEYINSQTKISFLHNTCNRTFDMLPNNFKNNQRCPYCNQSKGERKIDLFLSKSNCIYCIQFYFEDLIGFSGGVLKFDFVIFNEDNSINCLIEYDGEQHYEWLPWLVNYEGFLKQQHYDELKNEYCSKNKIKLIRIPYWEYDNIDEILKEKIFS